MNEPTKEAAARAFLVFLLSLTVATPIRADGPSTLYCVGNAYASRDHDDQVGWAGRFSPGKVPDAKAPFDIAKRGQFAGYIFAGLDTSNPRIRPILPNLEDWLADFAPDLIRKMAKKKGVSEELVDFLADPANMAEIMRKGGLEEKPGVPVLHKDEVKGTVFRRSGETVFFMWEWGMNDFFIAAVDLKRKKATIGNVAQGLLYNVSVSAFTADCQ